MIALVAASVLYMSALQAGIAGPTDAFRACLRAAATKAKSEKVTADGIEAYLKNACTPQMGTLSEVLIAFRMKNGMSRKAAVSDAAMTVDDYISTPADNYKFMAEQNAPKVQQASAPATATPPAPQRASSQPPKP